MFFIMALQSGVSPKPEQNGAIFWKKSCTVPGGQQDVAAFFSVSVFLVSSLIFSSFVFELPSVRCSFSTVLVQRFSLLLIFLLAYFAKGIELIEDVPGRI
jgi:hypothetical protein